MYRLCYKSKSTSEINWDTVRDILHTSEANNSTAGITGLLMATSSHYLQVLEGPFESINKTFMRIVKDSRHHEINLIGFTVVDARLFEGWGMKGLGIFELNKDIEENLINKYGKETDGSLHFPLEEWMVLSLIQDINLMGELPDWKK